MTCLILYFILKCRSYVHVMISAPPKPFAVLSNIRSDDLSL
jgi:hypothetical protein